MKIRYWIKRKNDKIEIDNTNDLIFIKNQSK